MVPVYYFWLLLCALIAVICSSIYLENKLKSTIKRMHLSSIASEDKLATAILDRDRKIFRVTSLLQKLRKRQVNFVRSITWFKTPETDIRVLKVQAREQLAIDLENGGAIEYLISENPRPDIDKTEITVKARIKTLNMK